MQANESCLRRILCRALRISALNMLLAIPKKMYSATTRWLRNIPFDAWTSAVAVTTILQIAALSAFTLCILAVGSWVLVTLTYYHVRHYRLKTTLLSYWIMWWMIYMFVFLELSLPLLELLPEEHGALVAFSSLALYLYIYNIRQPADHNKSQHSYHRLQEEFPDLDTTADITSIPSNKALDGNTNSECSTSIEMKAIDGETDCETSIFANGGMKFCKDCREFVSRCATHCHFCDCCVLQRYHHSLWLNCCITQTNYPFYIVNMALATFTLSFYANLVMTTICHPFVLLNVSIVWILMPDDCHEVFDVYIFGLNFVLAVHALVMAVYMGVTFIQHMYLTYRYKRPIFEEILKSYQH